MPEMSASLLEFKMPPMIDETPTRKIRIVLADDHPIVRDGLKKMLTLESDLEVVGEANDGREALEQIQMHEPDILLLDLRMPNLDGLGALQTLQHINRKTKVKIITHQCTRKRHIRRHVESAIGHNSTLNREINISNESPS